MTKRTRKKSTKKQAKKVKAYDDEEIKKANDTNPLVALPDDSLVNILWYCGPREQYRFGSYDS